MKEFYFYAERPIHKTIEEIFLDFKIHYVSKEDIKKNNLTNKNILLIFNEDLAEGLSKFFFF